MRSLVFLLACVFVLDANAREQIALKLVANLEINGETDDVFYDAKRNRLYLSCGEGFLDVVAQQNADRYETVTKLPTTAGARTHLFIPELDRLCLAVPHHWGQNAEIRVYQTEP